jgi:hypothetical protein
MKKNCNLKRSTHEIEKIVDIIVTHNTRQYLIKWKGYKDHKNTWEPSSNLTHYKDALFEFHKNHDTYCDSCSYLTLNARKLREHKKHCQGMVTQSKVS